MKNILARTSDHGFYLSFTVDVDLTTVTGVRLVVARPDNTNALRDLASATWNTLSAGDVLNVAIDSADFTSKGSYVFQVFARRVNGATEEVAYSSQPFKMNVDDPVVADPWQAI
ncbi:MAG: hypothetical protein AB9Q19_01265 [Candidatus Reddybacter sp.]